MQRRVRPMTRGGPSAAGPRKRSRKRISEIDQTSAEHERSRKILRERARRLAIPIEEQSVAKLEMSLVTLRIGDHWLAIETRFVLGTVPGPPVVNLPRSGAHVEGLSLVRGQLLPVFQLLEILGLPSAEAGGRSQLAILGVDQPEFGVSVDEVLPSRAIPLVELRELNTEDSESRGFVRSMTTEGTIVLDGQALLNHPSLFL